MPIANGLKGYRRKVLVKEHRLQMYCQALDMYIQGKADYNRVRSRAVKLKEIARH